MSVGGMHHTCQNELVTSTNNNSQIHKNLNNIKTSQRNMGNSTENGDYPQDQDNCIETESNCSMEDAVAKLEHALRRNFKSNEEDSESLEMIEEGT